MFDGLAGNPALGSAKARVSVKYNGAMRILLTNDDGIESPGLAVLRQALDGLGEISTIAPLRNHSAVARSITIDRGLTVTRQRFGDGFTGHGVDGTPVDCVRIAVLGVVAEAPEMIVSGINLGGNLGTDVTYSGTVGAALEGALRCLPGVAFSIDSREPRYLDDVVPAVRSVLQRVIANGLPPQTVLNVNLPDRPPDEIGGVRVTRLGGASCADSIFIEGQNGSGRTFHLACERPDDAAWPHSDFEALQDGFVSLTPLRFNLVDQHALAVVSRWDFEEFGGRPATPPATSLDEPSH